MENMFKINVGDWSDDGHGINEVVIVKSTKPVDEVLNAFIKSGEKLNVVKYGRFLIAEEYEDSTLNNQYAKSFENAGIKFDDLVDNESDDDEPMYYIKGSEEIVHLVMRIAQKELDFEYKIITNEIPSFNGWYNNGPQIGYGLFM